MMEWAKRTDGVIFVAMTMLLLLLTATGHTPGRSASIVLLALGVVLFGLPHGALDPLVAQRALDMHSAMGHLLFVLGYALIAAMYGFVWRWSAPVGLATFLCISAFHFGTDWEQRGRVLTRCAYGLAIVTLPVLRHASETQHIYAVLSPAAAEGLVQFSRIVALPAALAACLAAVVQWRVRRSDLLEFSHCSTSVVTSASSTVRGISLERPVRKALRPLKPLPGPRRPQRSLQWCSGASSTSRDQGHTRSTRVCYRSSSSVWRC